MSIQLQAAACNFIEVGAYTYGQPLVVRTWRSIFPEDSRIKIGKFCSLADNIVVFTGGNHRTDWISTFPFPTFDWPGTHHKKHLLPTHKGDIIIGNDVWIGSHATLMSGVKIGDGAVIGAMSVVASRIPPYGIAVGNPARVIKKRFSDEIINKLLEIAWWNWPLHNVQECASILSSGDVQALFDYAKKLKK